MPNHFLTVGLCARDYSRLRELGKEDLDEISLEPLVGANLCELINPLPSELDGIISPSNQRYVHKTTGEVCRDSSGPDIDPEAWGRVSLSHDELESLRAKYGATNWYDWQRENWGTKWGTYDLKVHEMGGDGSPILIEFQTAWGPPSPEMMCRINDYLRETYCLTNILWIGHDPANDTTSTIEVASDATPA